MRFRPCIDIHNGHVKQIVGSSLSDNDSRAEDNFISEYDAGYYANMYKHDGLYGGHIILLNPSGSEYYDSDIKQAKKALEVFRGGMQLGGGVNSDNAADFLDMGASHVIVTSYVFREGIIDYKRLERLVSAVGREHIVLDLSCKNVNGDYYIVTDRWQKITNEVLNKKLIKALSECCDEFLVHAVDVEGKALGVEKAVVEILGSCEDIKITYAGGIHSIEDIKFIREHGRGKVDFTIGSALDLFGGSIPYKLCTLQQW